MSVGDEMANERNREIANDNYYQLKWLLAEVQEHIAAFDEKLAWARGRQYVDGAYVTVLEVLTSLDRTVARLRARLR
jgi:hypothetical protein